MPLFGWLINRFWKEKNGIIPKNIFVEEEENTNTSSSNGHDYDLTFNVLGIYYRGQLIQGIDSVYSFLTIDMDKKGYNDAITNSDASNLQNNLKLLYYDLTIVIERALSFYDEKIKEQEFFIKSRNDVGLTDVAAQITTEMNKILELVSKIKAIENDTVKNQGKSQRLLLSYEIGFKRGLAALTATKLFPEQSIANNK
jgi:hypothetical protein